MWFSQLVRRRTSEPVREGLGSGLVDAYLKLKHVEWNAYARFLTQWERDHTLDC